MSENLSRQAGDFSQYDAMSDEALEEILRLDSEAPEGQESDTERILYIAELLAHRQNPTPGNIAQEAWDSFLRDYLPVEEEMEAPDKEKPTSTPKPKRLWIKRLAAMAAVIALLIAIPVAVGALGGNEAWEVVGRWSKGIFSFGQTQDPTSAAADNEGITRYTSLQEAMKAADIAPEEYPTWIPERFVLDKVIVNKTLAKTTFFVSYSSGETHMRIQIMDYLQTSPANAEVDDAPPEIYMAGGREYYIFRNIDQVRAAWFANDKECYISGDLTIEELKRMIDSIGKEE